MKTYTLINPQIGGSFETRYESKTPIQAAEKLWDNLTEYIVDSVPRFMFTLKGGNKYHHFEVKEDIETNEYSIKEKQITAIPDDIEMFQKAVNQYTQKLEKKQVGGLTPPRKLRHYKDKEESTDSSLSTSSIDSDSDSDDEYYPKLRRTSPLVFFHYSPKLYACDNNCLSAKNTQTMVISSLKRPIIIPRFAMRVNPIVTLF
jgi:hypothetical protein